MTLCGGVVVVVVVLFFDSKASRCTRDCFFCLFGLVTHDVSGLSSQVKRSREMNELCCEFESTVFALNYE